MFRRKFVDKTDVEILWVLKQSQLSVLGVHDMVKNNKKLSINDELKEKLRSLEEAGMIEQKDDGDADVGYVITKKGSDLIWKGETWVPIFNLIKLVDPEKYTSNEIRRITNKSLIECVRDIEYLRKEIKLVDGESRRFKLYFVLSEKGKSYSDEIDP